MSVYSTSSTIAFTMCLWPSATTYYRISNGGGRDMDGSRIVLFLQQDGPASYYRSLWRSATTPDRTAGPFSCIPPFRASLQPRHTCYITFQSHTCLALPAWPAAGEWRRRQSVTEWPGGKYLLSDGDGSIPFDTASRSHLPRLPTTCTCTPFPILIVVCAAPHTCLGAIGCLLLHAPLCVSAFNLFIPTTSFIQGFKTHNIPATCCLP